MPDAVQTTASHLFSPITIRGVTARNRIVVSPMCQYSAVDGHVADWHFEHHARFAHGGAGIGFVEATGVEARGRITPGCPGIWSDDHVEGLARIVRIYESHGAVPAIQIAHAGRKASSHKPWDGGGPLGAGEGSWQTVSSVAEPMAEGWHRPHALSEDEIGEVVEAWRQATIRSREAGFRIVEIHGAHGYLIHQFLSPLCNRRDDGYGGDRQRRMRFALEIAEAVRSEWPDDRPLFYRTSAVDGIEARWSIEDTVALARELKARGVDVIDCSSGGIRGPTTTAKTRPAPGFQVPYADRVRREAGMATMAVGFITDPGHAESIVREGKADLVALARELLWNPCWPLHAAQALGADPGWSGWPVQYGWYLVRRAKLMAIPPGESLD